MDNDTHAITAGVSRAITAGLMAGGYQTQAIRDALLAEFVVTPRADLPEVTGDEIELEGPSVRPEDLTVAILRADALTLLAHAEAREARESEATAAEAKRESRREALVKDLYGTLAKWENMEDGGQLAIDRLMDAQDEIARLESRA